MIRRISVRIDILRNGALYKEAQAVGDADVYMDSQAAIKSSFSGTFRYDPDIDWLSDEIQPNLIIDGEAYPLGVFRAGSVSMQINEEGGAEQQVEAFDRCYLLQQRRTETLLHFGAGTAYLDAIKSLLSACGISLVLATPSEAVLATDREDWDVGTDYLTITNQLLSEINYKALWFNATGFAILEPLEQPSAEAIDHVYDATTVMSVTRRSCTIDTDIFDKPNVFVAIVSNPDYPEPLVAKAENNSPLSPQSIIRRGFRVTQVEKVDNIADADALQRYVDNLCFDSMQTSEVVQITTALMPGHGLSDTVAVIHPDFTGLCQETAWYMQLTAGGEMTHELKKVVYPQ